MRPAGSDTRQLLCACHPDPGAGRELDLDDRTAREVEDARLKSEFEHLVKTCRNELGESLESLHASAEQMEPTDEIRRLNEMSLDDLAADDLAATAGLRALAFAQTALRTDLKTLGTS